MLCLNCGVLLCVTLCGVYQCDDHDCLAQETARDVFITPRVCAHCQCEWRSLFPHAGRRPESITCGSHLEHFFFLKKSPRRIGANRDEKEEQTRHAGFGRDRPPCGVHLSRACSDPGSTSSGVHLAHLMSRQRSVSERYDGPGNRCRNPRKYHCGQRGYVLER